MAQQMLGVYGSQPTPMPGQANVGYGPGGQVYNMQNPVVMTTSGMRPLSASRPVAAAGTATPMQVSQQTQFQQANLRPAAWTQKGKIQAQQQQQGGSGNPLLDALGGGGNIQTSITPQNIYSGQQTQEAVNQAVASSSAPLPWLQNQFAGKGMNVNSPATIARAMTPYAQGLSQGQAASAQIPLQDITANAQHYSAGEQARENEALGWGRLQTSAQGINNNARMNTLQSILGMLGAFV
jgi:hypothetical protein